MALALALTASPSARAQERDARPTLRIAHAAGALRIDGVLDEPAWQSADSIASFTAVEPRQGAVPGGRTVVRVITTADAIIFGVRADYAPGVRIVSYARSRDAALDSEDHIKIVLDTYGDGRSGYVFAVNANGARYDALISSQGGSENSSWDGIWEAATARTATGWSLEIRVPVKSLLFRRGLSAWGFNVQRRTQALQETDRWASATPDYAVTRVSRAGVLTGVPPFDLGIGLSVRPSVTGSVSHDGPALPAISKHSASLDVTQRLGANALVSLTENTDFAETDVDQRRVNLTRFSLFFPEKRTFFLEGADIFDFGMGLNESLIPFFSRRIGLNGETAVPIVAGAKLNGRAGGTSYGALAVRTGRSDSTTAASDVAVLRVKHDVLGESSVGFIATAGDPSGRSGAWLAGPDLTYQTSHFRGDKILQVGAWALGVGRDGLRGDRSAAGFALAYPNDLWDIGASYKRIGDGFDPSLGFVPRTGVHLAAMNVTWQPRPKQPFGPLHVRQCFWQNELTYAAGLTGGWQSYEIFMAPINCRFESGDRVEVNIIPTGERLAEPFQIADGVTVPAGEYRFYRFRLEAGLAAKRRFSAQATWWFGSFYNGYMNQYQLTGAWKPSPFFIMEFNGEHDIGLMSTGRFTQDVYSTRLRLNVSPDLQFTSFVQYDTDSHAVGTNARVRWTFSPLGDFFLVYNHEIRTRDPVTLRPEFGFGSNQLQAKIQYAFRY